jgi:large subunit ribosomal protein L5
MNKMQEIRREKMTFNIGVGQPGDQLNKAKRLLKQITGLEPVETSSQKRIPTWGVRPNLSIACKVTVRGKNAEELLKRLLIAKGNKLPRTKFDDYGNLSFGLHEYIDIPGVKYDPTIGIIGFEVAITLERPGFRIKRRSMKKTKVATKHKIKKEEAIQFIKDKFNTEIVEKESQL